MALTKQEGSVRYVVNNSGAILDHIVYGAFGNIISQTNSSNAMRMGYTGQVYDTETGLNYDHARYYDSQSGRFISQDPKGFAAGDANLYRYVGNNPLTMTDPLGMDSHVRTGASRSGGSSWWSPISSVASSAWNGVTGAASYVKAQVGLEVSTDLQMITHPLDTASMYWDSFKQEPVYANVVDGIKSTASIDYQIAKDVATFNGRAVHDDYKQVLSGGWDATKQTASDLGHGLWNVGASIGNADIAIRNAPINSANSFMNQAFGSNAYQLPTIPTIPYANPNSYQYISSQYYAQSYSQSNLTNGFLSLAPMGIAKGYQALGKVVNGGAVPQTVESASSSVGTVLKSNGRVFYGTPQGQLIEAPLGYQAVTAQNGKGLVLLPEGQMLGNNSSIIRWSEPNSLYPNGSFRYYNSSGQPLIPSTGKPGSNAFTHFTPDYQGPLVNYPGKR